MKLYIAYGSNLNVEQMKHRCPTAKLVGTGTLENCILDFRCMSSLAFATIHSKVGHYVPVAYWEIDRTAEYTLDVYEGYPRLYDKQLLPITKDGKTQKAIIYVMNELATPGLPSRSYVQTIYKGYLDVGLNVKDLEKICENCGFSLRDML